MINMEITKPNDMLVALVNDPMTTPVKLLNSDIKADNTSVLSREQYKSSKFIQNAFKDPETGKFNDIAFENAYNKATQLYSEISDEDFVKGLSEITYSPFDVTRPIGSKTFKVDVEFKRDFNPFQQLYSRTGVNSIDENPLSIREIAQQHKIFDYDANEWLDKSVNDKSLFSKFFGDTLVYAQWDEDGYHKDLETGRSVKHTKGDWKYDAEGNVYIETLGKRELYGKQVVNPMDTMTTDGSAFNKYDFFDSDDREKSAVGTTFKLAASIAPYLIPGINTAWGYATAGLTLASVLPSFAKSIEGILMGDDAPATGSFTDMENYLAKFTAKSYSDKAQSSMFNYEQMGDMVTSIFSQIYQQRAAASASKWFTKARGIKLSEESKELAKGINDELLTGVLKGKLDINDAEELSKAAMQKLPEMQDFIRKQSSLAKALSLGYMALTTTGDIYGEGIESGYSRRTAGLAAILTAAGQYGIMSTNPFSKMTEWFLDEKVGFDTTTKKSLREAAKGLMDDVEPIFVNGAEKTAAGKAGLLAGIKTFNGKLGNIVFRTSAVEGVEEVTEQAIQDAGLGIVDALNSILPQRLGGQQKGSYGGWDNVFSQSGFQNYLANLIGGMVGGPMFELNNKFIEPLLTGNKIQPEDKQTLYQLVASGKTQELIDTINKNRKKLGNQYLGPVLVNGEPVLADKGYSQADVIADASIQIVKNIDGILNSNGLKNTNKEIVQKALVSEILIKQLEKSKGSGKIGFEGLILNDYYDNVNKIVERTSELNSLPETDEEGRKRLTEEITTYKQNVEDILQGKKAEEYFSKATWLLSNVSDPYVSLDKNSYVKHKYGKEYYDLADKGAGLTKERADKEHEEYLNSTDIRKYIDVAYNVYKDIEKQANPFIKDFVETGYNEERKKTFNKILDLKHTIDQFNTATDEESKQKLLESFVQINTDLQNSGYIKTPVWDTYNINLAERLFNAGLIGNYDENDNFVPVEELSEEHKQKINDLVKTIPPTVNTNLTTKYLNQQIFSVNNVVNAALSVLSMDKDTEKSEADRLELEATKIPFIIGDYLKSPVVKALYKEQADEIETAKSTLGFEGITDEDFAKLSQYYNNPYYGEASIDEIISSEIRSRLQNIPLPEITEENEDYFYPAQKMAESGNIEIGNIPGFDEYLLEAKKLWDSKDSIILQKEALTKSILFRNYLETVNNPEELVEKVQSDNFSDQDLNVLKSNLSELLSTFNNLNSAESNSRQFVEEVGNINKKYEALIENSRPDIFKMNNLALDLITDFISDGSADGAIAEEGQKMADARMDEIKNSFFKDNTITNNSALIDVLENADKIVKNITTNIPYSSLYDSNNKAIIAQYENNEGLLTLLSDDSVANERLIHALLEFTNSKANIEDIEQLKKFYTLRDSGVKLISNPIYKFLEKFQLSLDGDIRRSTTTVFNLLEEEDKHLIKTSNVTNYELEGVKEQDMRRAISTLRMVQSAINAMSTTNVTYDDPVGFIASRQNFVKKYKLESDVNDLYTITSDVATLMNLDIDRLITKLQFMLDLSTSNAGRIFGEQETIRTVMGNTFLDIFSKISKNSPVVNNAPVIPDLSDILNSNDTAEKKLLKIEERIYNTNKTHKKEALSALTNSLTIYPNSSNLSRIDKNFTGELSNFEQAIHFATVLSYNPRNVAISNYSLINSDISKSPFYTQEYDARVAMASVLEPELFAMLINENPTIGNVSNDLITYILGTSGSGKTNVVFRLALEHYLKSFDDVSVWFSGPYIDQATKLKSDVTSDLKTTINSSVFDKLSLYRQLGIDKLMEKINSESEDPKNPSNTYISFNEDTLALDFKNTDFVFDNMDNLPDLLFIDEITHFSALEQKVLNEVSRASLLNSSDGRFMKIITAGDTTQSGKNITIKFDDKNSSSFAYNVERVNGIFTPRLTMSVRAGNSQKRENNDFVAGLNDAISKIYADRNIAPSEKPAEVGKLLAATGFTLSYYKDGGKLHGDLVTKTLTKDIINIMTSDNTKTIGILTKTGTISPELQQAFSDAGVMDANGDIPGVVTYTLENVQGKEADYFIFDTNLIASTKQNHIIKDFYTYMSRAKLATIVMGDALDSWGLKNKEKADESTLIREPLTKEAIQRSKNTRIDALKGVLDNNFTFVLEEEKEPKTPAKEPVITGVSLDTNDYDIIDDQIVSDTKTIGGVKADDGNCEFYSFYNNYNAQIVKDGDKIVILNSDNELNTDLNINLPEVENPELEYKSMFNGWLELKNSLLYSTRINYTKDTLNFLSQTFKQTLDSETADIKVEYALTAVPFSNVVNRPGDKAGYDQDKVLVNESPFVNLSAKLIFEDQVHYITLATIATNSMEKFREKFGNESKTYVAYNKFMKSLSNKISYDKVYEIKTYKKLPAKIITSTWFATVESEDFNPKTYIENLTERYKGFKVNRWPDGNPKIEIFPKDEKSFMELLDKFTFGEPRDAKTITINENGEAKQIPLTEHLFKRWRGKPYIIGSYREDLEGTSDRTTQARLIPVKVEKRSIQEVTNHITNWRAIRWLLHNKLGNIKYISPEYKNLLSISEEGDVGKYSEEEIKNQFKYELFNLVSTTQMLDLFISLKLNNPKLFNAVTDEEDGLLPYIVKRTTESGREEANNIQIQQLKSVFTLIDKASGDNVKTIKDNILSNVKTLNNWGSIVPNIFLVKDYIKRTKNRPENAASTLSEEELGRLAKAEELIDSLYAVWNDVAFYWNIPTVANANDKTKREVPSNFNITNKVYITGIPEGPRLMWDLSKELKLSSIKTQDMEEVVKTEIKKPVEVPQVKEVRLFDKVNDVFVDLKEPLQELYDMTVLNKVLGNSVITDPEVFSSRAKDVLIRISDVLKTAQDKSILTTLLSQTITSKIPEYISFRQENLDDPDLDNSIIEHFLSGFYDVMEDYNKINKLTNKLKGC